MESDEEFAARLSSVLVGGLRPRVVEIVAYDPLWPQRFVAERVRIESAMGETARRIEHIGSTSVPGLAAKPIVDIQVSVDDPDDDVAFTAALEAAGYELRVREPAHRMFRTPAGDVQVHVWPTGGDDARRHLLFRDWLRSHPDDRILYEETKRGLAGREWPDVNYYARAKGPTIEAIMARATAGDVIAD